MEFERLIGIERKILPRRGLRSLEKCRVRGKGEEREFERWKKNWLRKRVCQRMKDGEG